MGFTGDDAQIKQILAGCLLFKRIEAINFTNNTYDTNYKETINNYSTLCASSVNRIAQNNSIYNALTNSIKKLQIDSFIEITKKQINSIYKLYTSNSERIAYQSSYNSKIYGAGNISMKESSRLSKVHQIVVEPIVQYYINTADINKSDVSVTELDVSNVGKRVSLSINGISSIIILTDIWIYDKADIKDYLEDMVLESDGTLTMYIK